MVITSSKTALRRLLIESFPNIDIAIEGVPFDSNHEMYLAIQFVIRPPTDPTYGPYYYREEFSFQIFVSDKLGVGSADAEEQAEKIREVFYKGLSLTEDSYRLHVLRTAHISGTVVTSDRLIVPLSIPVSIEVYEE